MVADSHVSVSGLDVQNLKQPVLLDHQKEARLTNGQVQPHWLLFICLQVKADYQCLLAGHGSGGYSFSLHD